MKVLYYERNGFCLWCTRLERGRFSEVARLSAGGFDLGFACGRQVGQQQVIGVNGGAPREHNGAFDDVPQFADIPGPAIARQHGNCFRGIARHPPSRFLGKQQEEIVCQFGNVFRPFSQRGNIDSHDVQRVPTPDGNGFLNEGTIFPDRIPGHKIGHAYQLPYRAITPQRAECSNLLVPVALSSTHVAMSSLRVEPTWMVLGQSSGIAAALALETKRAVQDLPYPELRARLLAQGQALDLLPLPPLR